MFNNNLRAQSDVNLDRFVWKTSREIPVDIKDLETLLNKRAQEALSLEERQDYLKKRQELVHNLFEAATKVLTDVQFQFFTAYNVVGMSEIQIADAFDVTQPYVSIVLSASNKKIRKHLKLD